MLSQVTEKQMWAPVIREGLMAFPGIFRERTHLSNTLVLNQGPFYLQWLLAMFGHSFAGRGATHNKLP